MNHENQRIYIGNLPFDITETEVLTKFSKYGNVLKVEMKYRSDPYSDVGLPCYAFLEMQIDSSKIERCFRKVSTKKWKGHSVKLELAKESFLSRLEKERQESTAPVGARPVEACQVPPEKMEKPTLRKNGPVKGNKRIRLDADTPASEDCREDASIIEKFESFSDVWKDLPADQLDGNNGQVGESGKSKKTKQSKKKVSDEKGLSEVKRLKSLEDRKKSFFEQKEAVKLALSSVDSNRTSNKRIVFDDDGFVPTSSSVNQWIPSVSDSQRKHESPAYTKPLFLEENESADEQKEDIDFKIKRQFEGQKGQKLLELQSQYASDKRFALDERFYDSDDNAEKDDPVNTEEISTNDEVKRQLEILQNIVGHELPPILNRKNTPKETNFMLRFDPTNADHAKYEIKETETKPVSLPQSKTGQKKTEKKKKEKHAPDCSVTTSHVSKDTFYKVSESLTESLKTKESGGFSLLKMFGSANDNDIAVDEEVVASKSVALSKSSMDWLSNPFRHDSSESESESEEMKAQSKPAMSVQAAAQTCGLWRETFFFKTNDARLSEGLEFFTNKTDNEENFSQRRKELKQIVTAKVKHNLRKSQPKKKKLGGTEFNRFRDTKKKNRVGGSKLKKFRKK